MKFPCVGISIEGSIIRSVEIGVDNGKPKLLAVNEIEASSNLWDEMRLDSGNSDQLISYLDPVIKALPETPNSIAIALDSKSAVIKVHLVDTGLPDEEKDEFIKWEARKRMGDSYGEYAVAIYPLIEDIPKFSKYLSVSVKNETIDILNSICSSLNIPLEVIDVDIFAGINAVLFLNKQASSGKTSILRYSESEYTATNLFDGEFMNSSLFHKEKDGTTFIFNSSVKHKDTEEIISSLSSDNLSNPSKIVDNLFIYQGATQGALLKPLLNKKEDGSVIEVDPFSEIELSDNVDNAIFKENPARFTEAFGMAIRLLDNGEIS